MHRYTAILIAAAFCWFNMGCGSSTNSPAQVTPDLEKQILQQQQAVDEAERAYQQSRIGLPPAGAEQVER